MKHAISFTLIATLLVLTFSSCIIHVKPLKQEDGKEIEKTFNLKDFNAINIMSYADVVYVPGDNYSVKVKTTEEEMERIAMNVSDSTLIITSKEEWELDEKDGNSKNVTHFVAGSGAFKSYTITIYVTSPYLKDVTINGSGSFECKDSIAADNLNIQIVGSGDIYIAKANSKTTKTEIAGSGDIKIDQLTSNEVSYNIVGSGDIKSKELHTSKSQLDISGSGDISVEYVDCKHADCLISGSGDIYLNGTLESLNQNCHGSGDVHTENLKTKQAIQKNEDDTSTSSATKNEEEE